MTYENLLIVIEDGIALVTINREKAMNALNTQTMLELKHFFSEEAPANPDIKGLILTGAGPKAFVAGADIKEFMGLEGKGGEFAKRGHDIFNLIENFSKPVIAAVNGFALGGGCELAMSCHLRIAAENARFGQPEVNLGIIPGYGGTQRLVQLIGKSKALELMMTTDMVNANEAYRLGLVNEVVPEGQAVERSREVLNKIFTKAPLAIAGIIESVNAFFDHEKNGFEVEVSVFGKLTETGDFEEGANAFVEKRKAEFKGR